MSERDLNLYFYIRNVTAIIMSINIKKNLIYFIVFKIYSTLVIMLINIKNYYLYLNENVHQYIYVYYYSLVYYNGLHITI